MVIMQKFKLHSCFKRERISLEDNDQSRIAAMSITTGNVRKIYQLVYEDFWRRISNVDVYSLL